MNPPRLPSVVARLFTALLAFLLLAAVLAAPASASTGTAGTPAAAANVTAAPPALANHAALTYINEVLTWLGETAVAPAPAAPAPVAEPVAIDAAAADALRAIDQLLRWLDYQQQQAAAAAAAEAAAVEAPTPAEAPAPAVEEIANVEPVEAQALRAIDDFLTKLDPAAQAAIPKGYVDLGHGVYGPEHLLRIRRCESTDQYDVASPTGKFRGAYQFSQQTWDWRAELNGRLDLVGAEITAVSPADQDQMAVWNYEQRNPYNEWPQCAYR